MTLLTSWPTVTDDDGTKTSGTIFNKALTDAFKSAIETLIHSSTNPTVTPEDVIDEVVAARGSKMTLDARLDVSLEEDGTLKSQSGLVTSTQFMNSLGLAGRNLIADSLFMLWPDGDSSAPAGWTLTGAGAAVARTGTGGGSYEASAPADSTKMKWGKFAVKITRGSADARLTRTVVPAARFPDGLKSRKVVVMVRCLTGVASQASIIADDGVTTTRGGTSGNGTWHVGDSTEDILYATHTMSGSATKLDVILEVAGSGAAYFGCAVACVSDIVPVDWFPERWGAFVVGSAQRGTATTGNQINEQRVPMPSYVGPGLIMVDTLLRCKTAPTGAAITVRPQKNAASSVYSTNPTIAAAANSGSRAPEGTYANRCFKADGTDYLTWDITTVGSGTAGDELNVDFVFLAPIDELKMLAA